MSRIPYNTQNPNKNFFLYPGTNSSFHPESSVKKKINTSTLYYYIGNNFEKDYQNINIFSHSHSLSYDINSILAIIYLNEQVLNKQVLKPD